MDKPCQCGHSKAEHLDVKVQTRTSIQIYRQCSKCMCIDYCAFSDEEYQDYRERTKEAVMNDLVSVGDILELCHNEINKIEDVKLRTGYLLVLMELCTRYGRNPEIWTKPEILKKTCEYVRVDPLGLVNIFHSVFLELAKKKGLLGNITI